MKTQVKTGLIAACFLAATVTFAKTPQTNLSTLHQTAIADTTPHKAYNKMQKAKNKSGDSTMTTGMYSTDKTADTTNSRASSGDYNNSQKSGDSSSAKPPRF